jgi:hypothetical protein
MPPTPMSSPTGFTKESSLPAPKSPKTVARGARLHPCRKWPARLTASVAEVRFRDILGVSLSASDFATDDWKEVPQGLKCENRISKDVSPGSGDRFKFVEHASFCRVTALLLCIRARLQSGRKGPTKIRALAPGLFFDPEFFRASISGRIRPSRG